MLIKVSRFGRSTDLNAAVVAAAEELAVHQRHGPHVLVGVQELGVATVPAQHLDAGALRHEAGHGACDGKALHGVSRVMDLDAPEHAVPELPHLLAHNKNMSDVFSEL